MNNQISLTDQQLAAIRDMAQWYQETQFKAISRPFYILSGCAGSGKTTIIRNFIHYIELSDYDVTYMAFSGKATQVLQKKGYIAASTIHSRIYNIEEDKDGKIHFFLKTKDQIPKSKLFVVDECSMVGDQIIKDLLSFDIPILFVGDYNQLEPIDDSNTILNKPDMRLDEPIRQGKENSIIDLAYKFMTSKIPIKLEIGKYGENVEISNQLDVEEFAQYEQVICGKHITRRNLNMLMKIDKKNPLPSKGEKMICRQNNWKISVPDIYGNQIFLTNGLTGICEREVSYDEKIHFIPDMCRQKIITRMDMKYYYENEIDRRNKDMDKFDLGYAITCHSSQGSEYDKVIVIMEPIGRNTEQLNKWIYTAITRAKKFVKIIINK